jgi:DNA-binding response OmpR family regulator
LKRILLIDDDEDITEMIKIVLGDRYVVESQANHINIPAKLKAFAPDLILLDNSVGRSKAADIVIDLRGKDGYNIVPLVLFSAHADIAGIAAQINADAYLTKPFNLDELYTCIDQLLNQTSPT